MAPAVCSIVEASKLNPLNIFLDKKTIAAPRATAPKPSKATAAALFAISLPLAINLFKSKFPVSGGWGTSKGFGPAADCCSLRIIVFVFLPFCSS